MLKVACQDEMTVIVGWRLVLRRLSLIAESETARHQRVTSLSSHEECIRLCTSRRT